MTSTCAHDYAEPVTEPETGDTVSQCCKCDEVLGAIVATLPEHWHDDLIAFNPDSWMCLGADFLNGTPSVFNPSDEWLIQLCPACGHSLKAYASGYSGESDDFMEIVCPSCFSVLFRYLTVVAPLQFEKMSDAATYEKYVKARLDRDFWAGEHNEMNNASWVFKKEARDTFDSEWHPRCPCCGTADAYADEIDFHHWDYDNDVGCMLCRDCHSYIHRGLTASEQAERTGDAWQIDAVKNLYERSTQHGLSFPSASHTAPSAYYFKRRFNIPTDNLPAGVEAAIKEVSA
jgi:hypothetical protein